MHYFVTADEIYFSCVEAVINSRDSDHITQLIAESDDMSVIYTYYCEVIAKLEKDKRILKLSFGYLISNLIDKKEIEEEYGIRLMPVHPDDFTV